MSKNWIISLFTSPPFWSAIGCIVVTIPISLSGSIMFALAAVWTAINELRASKELDVRQSSEKERAGLRGLFSQKLESPGFFPFLQFLIYAWTGLVAVTDSNIHFAVPMFLQSIGALSLERAANLVYEPAPRNRLDFERYLESIWKLFPQRLRIVLRDPGALFCLGGGLLTLLEVDYEQLSVSGLVLQIFFYLGLFILLLGILRGFLPLFSKATLKDSGLAIHLGGVGHILLGIATLYVGSRYTGSALIIWGISNFLYGSRIDHS